MAISTDDVRKIAHLARLDIDDAQATTLTSELSQIVDFVDQLSKANTDGIEPMAHPQNITQRLRPDEVTESNQRELFQSLAPATEMGLYLVPAVIE